jgi:S-adenosylmethionine hydrolase
MNTVPVIALLTDFGHKDTFTGVMKGVIASICRHALVIDLIHSIDSQDIRQAAFHLDRSFPFFPEGTVFACVVDPGVGTNRRAIAVDNGHHRFVAPDNGLLTPVLSRYPQASCFTITNTVCMLPSPSATFHGRDIFSPAAAYLASGTATEMLGRRIPAESCKRIVLYENHKDGSIWTGEIISVDHFGNLVTSFESDLTGNSSLWTVSAGTAERIPIVRTYGDVDAGKPLAYVGSSGMIEIAVRNGNASLLLRTGKNAPVRLERS